MKDVKSSLVVFEKFLKGLTTRICSWFEVWGIRKIPCDLSN